MTFWDFCAPFYDMATKANGRAYGDMLKAVFEIIPENSSVLEIAAGTGAISMAVAEKASKVICTDISGPMLKIAQKKAKKRNISNVSFQNLNIFDTGLPDNEYDVVIASQVLNLIDHPQKAAAELRRIAKKLVVLPMSLIKNLRGIAKLNIGFYRLFGFAPKLEFDNEGYTAFLSAIGFDRCEIIQIPGRIPIAIAVFSPPPMHQPRHSQ